MVKPTKFLAYTTIVCALVITLGNFAVALPPMVDAPEEILRTEIITSARSPVDGEPLTPAEYAELQSTLQIAPTPKLDTKVRETIFLLRLRKLLIRIFPFLDI